MKIKIELFGAARDFSKQDYLELTVPESTSIKEVRENLMDFIQAKYPENKNYLEIVKRSAFANEHNEIVQDHYQISANSKLCIIPPVGGG
jgi:molybdopterin synthase sulfur carrier subunit